MVSRDPTEPQIRPQASEDGQASGGRKPLMRPAWPVRFSQDHTHAAFI